jgi:hypothetical protein
MAKERDRAALGDSDSASHHGSGAHPTLKWRGSIEVFGAVVAMAMGKSQTRGHRCLYLKGNGVTWVRDFILNLISKCLGFVSSP